jgi:hypothetical protein
VKTSRERDDPVGAILLFIALFAALFCVLFSLVASPSYVFPVKAALLSGALHLACVIVFLMRSHTRLKWLVFASVPIAVFSIDNLGRMVSLIGLNGFRILI